MRILAKKRSSVARLVLCFAALAACAPVVRPAPFSGARDQVTDVSLLGPFDGQVVDTNTGDPIAGATVVGVWSYDAGDGFIAPQGAESVTVVTDQAGRYRLPAAKLSVRGSTVRLVSFRLVVYKRGYVGYRSDSTFEGRPRNDFTLRHNRVRLRKWAQGDSHARHIEFLAAPPEILQLSKWEREAANLDLYRTLGGDAAPVEEPPEQVERPKLQVLDATKLLTPDDVRLRTNYPDAFEVKELEDLARTHFYHGVHLEAVGREEDWDLAYRVWKQPPQGLDEVIETFKVTLPDVEQSADVTPETWVLDSGDVRAVAFVDREREVAVLLACRAKQCLDIETAIVLARFIFDNVEKLELVDAPSAGAPAAPATSEDGSQAGDEPSTEEREQASPPATGEMP